MTAIDRASPPFAFWTCARRSAADNPAGPPPTISTSTSSVSRSAIISRPQDLKTPRPQGLGSLFLQLRNNRGSQLEQIALDAVIGNLEDRRLGVLVDSDDGA